MSTMSAHPLHFDDVLQAPARRRWVLWLLLAAGCGMRTSLDQPGTSSPVSVGGATSSGGASGQGDGGNRAGTKSTGGSAGVNASGGSAEGGITGRSGLTGSGGLSGRGGIAGTGGSVGSGGTVAAGGSSGSGGAVGSGGSSHSVGSGGVVGRGGTTSTGGVGGTGGSTGSGSIFGLPCTNNQDCPSDATCCDGSDEHCDGTRLPSGNGANPGELVVSADGLTVTDTITGLLWQRDGSGARSGCSGGIGGARSGDLTCTWAEAQAYCASLTSGGISGWRLPAVMELYSIVDFTGTSVATTIDLTAFPNTPSEPFWTSFPYAGSLPDAWGVSFATGMSGIFDMRSFLLRARCVRGSRCYPTNRLVTVSSGLVHDTLTNLVWQQQASPTTMSLADAQTYCSSAGSGFRLPTLKELLSIVDLTVIPGAPINQTAFPNTPAQEFWASPPCASSFCQGWGVGFNSTSGSTFFYGGLTSSLEARCVR
jgi:hypothetical protein